jgi:hypothetical protein
MESKQNLREKLVKEQKGPETTRAATPADALHKLNLRKIIMGDRDFFISCFATNSILLTTRIGFG